ncbi:DUF3099 domain-containing protein [Nocardia stercoris]|uniref:DUF3099 domain-containing protein n=1 Tax=Nocardia stercoris TaxID=2483361 RepID=A0A3M2KZX9_9NOCA|nr:DUF3099 domain-containing protein [Nocardia stercoris]RMI30226.1 DUF3099 domain-containing protein [Nocardia stercoris]
MQRDGKAPDAEVPHGDGVSGATPAEEPEVEVHPAGFFTGDPEVAKGFFRDNSKKRPTLITEAAVSLEQQHRDRVRRYSILMGFRIPCLIGAAAAYGAWHNSLISLAIIGVSIPLPWMAVLIANDRPPRRGGEPSRWDGRRGDQAALEQRRAIEGGHDS